MSSISQNKVCRLVELHKGCRPIRCKWVFKTQQDGKGQVKKYKARLVANDYSKQKDIDYKETFSPISTKNSLWITMGKCTLLIFI